MHLSLQGEAAASGLEWVGLGLLAQGRASFLFVISRIDGAFKP
jgi:hypothetical protein